MFSHYYPKPIEPPCYYHTIHYLHSFVVQFAHAARTVITWDNQGCGLRLGLEARRMETFCLDARTVHSFSSPELTLSTVRPVSELQSASEFLAMN